MVLEAQAAAAPIEGSDDVGRGIQAAAQRLGFVRIGFAAAESFDSAVPALRDWLEAGRQGEMTYMNGALARADPLHLLRSARTIVSVALPYDGASAPVALRRSRDDGRPLRGTVARYARGADYHRVLKDKLYELAKECARILD